MLCAVVYLLAEFSCIRRCDECNEPHLYPRSNNLQHEALSSNPYRNIRLEYALPSPTDLILFPQDFDQYNMLFQFLFLVKRVQVLLLMLFQSLGTGVDRCVDILSSPLQPPDHVSAHRLCVSIALDSVATSVALAEDPEAQQDSDDRAHARVRFTRHYGVCGRQLAGNLLSIQLIIPR